LAMSRMKGRSHAFNRSWINSSARISSATIMFGLTQSNGAPFVSVPQPEPAEHPLVEKT
jgi:hypothetical protein